MQVESNWVQDALRDWGRRHCGRPGDEIDYPRQVNFARYMLQQGFDRPTPVEPTEESCQVDAAVGELYKHGRQGRIEYWVLRYVYLNKLARREIAKRMVMDENSVRHARMMGEGAVRMYLVSKCGWEAPIEVDVVPENCNM